VRALPRAFFFDFVRPAQSFCLRPALPNHRGMKIVVLDAGTLSFGDEAWSQIAQLGELTLHLKTAHETDAIAAAAADAQVVLTNKVPLNAAALAALPQLRMVGVLATGYNIIDTRAAAARGVIVCNVPGYSTASVAQHTLALALELSSHISIHAAAVAAGAWVDSEHFTFMLREPRELAGKTVGIVGFGEIGRMVGAVFNALGCRIVASMNTPRNPPDWPGFAFLSNDEIFAQADIVTLHCPQTPQNTGFVNRALLERMKRDAILINTARGGLINEADLAEALNMGKIAGAGLDVLSREPMHADNPLRSARNCVITPHIAWASREARTRLLAITRDNIAAFAAGSPRNVVS